jgi:hypothetical protein
MSISQSVKVLFTPIEAIFPTKWNGRSATSAIHRDSMPARVAVLRVSPPRTSRGFAAPPELVMDLEVVLDCRVDVVSARGLRDRFRQRVLADALIL